MEVRSMFRENWELPLDDPEVYLLPVDEATRRQLRRAQRHEARQTVLLGLAVWVVTSLVQIGSLLAMAPTGSRPDVTASKVSVREVREAEISFWRQRQEGQ
jgi:hypothetical protein